MEPQAIASDSARPIELNFVLSRSDFVRAQVWQFFRNWFIRFVYVVNLVAAATVLSGIVRRGLQPGDLTGVLWLSIWFVWMPLMLVWSGWSQHRRLMSKGHTCSWRFSESAIETKSPQAEVRMSWDALERVVERPHALYLFVQKRLFHIIPTRALPGPTELQRLRDLLRVKLGDKARLRRTGAR